MKHPKDPTAKRDFVIGGACMPRPQRMTPEGEAIQAALLAARHEQVRFDRHDRIVLTACAIAAAVAIGILLYFTP